MGRVLMEVLWQTRNVAHRKCVRVNVNNSVQVREELGQINSRVVERILQPGVTLLACHMLDFLAVELHKLNSWECFLTERLSEQKGQVAQDHVCVSPGNDGMERDMFGRVLKNGVHHRHHRWDVLSRRAGLMT
eukprot:CAMPEP_0177630444 /NCGR_PEP_ID=MMETSP0447-20121125/1213_1 /TAXON_ID=0 /ORGANISM="Stygamoeba regulata, Strain BSH-02190019" /LENGTH=132 /DNA_ID=CAMNT_0019131849 /DNA_START=51 /DNA_END=449 /DNA_ORIENTATION=-